MNNSHCPALRRRRRCEMAPSDKAASWLRWKGKVTVLRLSAHILPAWPGGLGDIQAVTVTLGSDQVYSDSPVRTQVRLSAAQADRTWLIWNPYEVYSRYMPPGIYHVYVGQPYIHGTYYVYAKYIKILYLCISWSFNIVNPCHGWGQLNLEHRTSQHSIILCESNATWFRCINLTYTLYIPCICIVYTILIHL